MSGRVSHNINLVHLVETYIKTHKGSFINDEQIRIWAHFSKGRPGHQLLAESGLGKPEYGVFSKYFHTYPHIFMCAHVKYVAYVYIFRETEYVFPTLGRIIHKKDHKSKLRSEISYIMGKKF